MGGACVRDNFSPSSNIGDDDILEVATNDAVVELGVMDEGGMRRELGGLMVKGGGVNGCGVLYSGVSLSTCLIKEVGVN